MYQCLSKVILLLGICNEMVDLTDREVETWLLTVFIYLVQENLLSVLDIIEDSADLIC